MSILVLCGAGASHGSCDCRPHPPPLGPKLFDQLCSLNGEAAALDEQTANLLRADFEAGIQALYAVRSEKVLLLMREAGIYFTHFDVGPNNLYIPLARAAIDCGSEVVFATTNYDTLLEQAILRAGSRVTYLSDRTPPRNLLVLKIHGSCNFAPVLPHGMSIRGIKLAVPDGIHALTGASMKAYESLVEARRFFQAEDFLAPGIAVYGPSKVVPFCSEHIDAIRSRYAGCVASARKIIIVGLKVTDLDTHVWSPLAGSTAWLGYVGPERGTFLEWAGLHKRANAHWLASTFEDSMPLLRRILS